LAIRLHELVVEIDPISDADQRRIAEARIVPQSLLRS